MKTLWPVPRYNPGNVANGIPHGEGVVLIVIILGGQADLLEIVRALGTSGGLAGRLHGRQQQRDQHGDDGDHHQQLDQGECGPNGATKRLGHDSTLLERDGFMG